MLKLIIILVTKNIIRLAVYTVSNPITIPQSEFALFHCKPPKVFQLKKIGDHENKKFKKKDENAYNDVKISILEMIMQIQDKIKKLGKNKGLA